MFDKTENLTLHIEGMSCEHCVKRVADALKAIKGVKKATVNLEAKSAEVTYIPAKTNRDVMTSAVCELGFKAE